MAKGKDTRDHPGRKVHKDRFVRGLYSPDRMDEGSDYRREDAERPNPDDKLTAAEYGYINS